MEIQFHPGSRRAVTTISLSRGGERLLLAAAGCAALVALSLAVTVPVVLRREARRGAALEAARESARLEERAAGVLARGLRLRRGAEAWGDRLARIAFLYEVPLARWPRALDRERALLADAEPEEAAERLARYLRALERARALINERERADASLPERSPSILPVQARDVEPSAVFGPRVSPWTGEEEFFRGVDLAAREGSPVVAAAAGTVVYAGRAPRSAAVRFARLGNLVVLSHGEAGATLYGHLSRLDTRRGDRVRRYQPIGAVGRTGWALAPQLHYEVWRFRAGELQPIDPLDTVLNRRFTTPPRSLPAMVATAAPAASETLPGLSAESKSPANRDSAGRARGGRRAARGRRPFGPRP